MIGLRTLQFGGRGSDSKGALPFVVFAFAIMALGYIGVFFANADQGGGVAAARVAGRRFAPCSSPGRPTDSRAR